MAKCRNIIETAKAQCDDAVDDTVKTDKDVQKQEEPVSQAQVDSVQDNLNILEDMEKVHLPKVKETIDGLNNFNLKSLKNQLNEENKKSQGKIAEIKKTFEDL